MTHVIMSGPIKPLTEVEKEFAKLKLVDLREGSCRATAHIPPKKVSNPQLRRDAKLRGYISLKRAAAILECNPATALMLTPLWRSQTIGSIRLFVEKDVAVTAEVRKRKQKVRK